MSASLLMKSWTGIIIRIGLCIYELRRIVVNFCLINVQVKLSAKLVNK